MADTQFLNYGSRIQVQWSDCRATSPALQTPIRGWSGLGKLGGWGAAQGARTAWVRALLRVPPPGLEGRTPPSACVCPHRKNYEALCQMYQKIQPLLENLHRNFIETRNNISEPRRVGWAREGRVGSPPPRLFLCHVCALVPGCYLDTCCEFCRLNLG